MLVAVARPSQIANSRHRAWHLDCSPAKVCKGRRAENKVGVMPPVGLEAFSELMKELPSLESSRSKHYKTDNPPSHTCTSSLLQKHCTLEERRSTSKASHPQ